MPGPESLESAQRLPTVSVIVTTHNRQKSLDSLVAALHCLEYPRDRIEVLVIDDGSDPPARIVASDMRFRLIRQEQRGPASARNAGIHAASGEFIAITDDDCRPHPAWIRGLCAAYIGEPEALIGGRTRNALHDNIYASTSQALIDYLYESLLKTSPANSFFTTCNSGGARASFLRLGGFDESFPLPAAEDRDVCDRWKSMGPLLYAPDAVVEHHHQMRFPGFTRQHFRYGRGARVLHRKRAARNVPTSIEGLSFYWRLITFPFRTQSFRRAVTFSLLFVVAQFSNTAGYLYESALNRNASG